MKRSNLKVILVIVFLVLVGLVVVLLAQGNDSETENSETWQLVKVVDGDTIDVSNSAGAVTRIRPVGINTPERGQCGFTEATQKLKELIGNQEIILELAGTDDVDKFGRLLRYIEVGGEDVGLSLIEAGHANAAYDSRTGYPKHFREDSYIAADSASKDFC
jgi:endonuclease YncB( thermonuclease family)